MDLTVNCVSNEFASLVIFQSIMMHYLLHCVTMNQLFLMLSENVLLYVFYVIRCKHLIVNACTVLTTKDVI